MILTSITPIENGLFDRSRSRWLGWYHGSEDSGMDTLISFYMKDYVKELTIIPPRHHC